MKRSNNLRFFLVFILFLLIIFGIGKYFIDIIIREEGLRSQQEGAELITITEADEQRTTWQDIKDKINNCEVDQVFQGHDLRVSIVTDEGTLYWAYEPEIDDVLEIAGQAREECNKEILMATE